MAHYHGGNRGYSGRYQTRVNTNCCDHYEHMLNGTWICGIEPGVCEGEYSPGGYLKGPSHERGGIPAIVSGNNPIELEGGEYIMNAQTTKALGTEFLDKLNSTETTYHPGGFERGQLPSPSMYAGGGKVHNRRNKMRRGRKPTKRMARGGRTRPAPRGKRMARGGVRGAMTFNSKRRPIKSSKSLPRMARGGKTRLQPRRMLRGGSAKYGTSNKSSWAQYKNNPCPSSDNYPDYHYFVETAVLASGEPIYFCCETRDRTEKCNRFENIPNLSDLIYAKLPLQ